MSVQNNVTIIGNLAKDCEGQYFQSKKNGQTMFAGKFTVCVNEKTKNNERTEYIICKMLGNSWQNVANYLLKGQQVAVNGKLQTGSYQDQNGVTHWTTDVLVDSLQLLQSPKNKSNNGTGQAPKNWQGNQNQQPQQNNNWQGNQQSQQNNKWQGNQNQ